MFSSLQEREAFFIKGPDVSVGPGSYDPFETQSSKEVDPASLYTEKDRKKSQKISRMAKNAKAFTFKSAGKRMEDDYNFNPGPGSYKVTSSLQKAEVIKEDSESPFYQIMERGGRVVKMQPYASDKIDRFNYLNMPEIGMQKKDYDKRQDINEKNLDLKYKKKNKRIAPHVKPKGKSWDTAPSIPASHNKMLFFSEDDESEKAEGTTSGSTLLKNQLKQSQEEKPEVSPCSYNPYHKKLNKMEKNSPWGMSNTQRIDFESNAKKLATGEVIGPGKYADSKNNIGNSGVVDTNKGAASIYQNQSSIFKSNVERMSYLEPKIKTFVGGKLVKGAANRPDLMQNSDVTIVPEITPGPGDYYNHNNESTMNTDHRPHHLQFFGSSETRTSVFDRNKNVNDAGYLDINEAVKQDRFHKGYSASFISGRDKDLLFSGNSNPAPGDYKTNGGLNRIDGKVWSKISTFGSTEKRFQKGIYESPGPGSYNTAKKDQKRKPVSGYAFKSNTKRTVFGDKKNISEFTNLQDYNSIASQIVKLSGGAPNNFTILKNERFVMPFNSCSTRFKSQNPSHMSTSDDLGPGYYSSQVKKMKSTQKNNLSFGRSERFQSFKNTAPGPGQYNNHRHLTWVK